MLVNSSTVQSLKEHVKVLLSLINHYKHFLDSFIIEFFIEDHWNKVDQKWRNVLDQMEPSDFSEEIFRNRPSNGYTSVLPLSLLAFKSCCHNLGICRLYDQSEDVGEFSLVPCQSKMIDHIFRKHVKPKKQHEIRKLAEVIMMEARNSNSNRVVDVGSGHGHLSRLLAIGHDVRVSSFETNPESVRRAKQFDVECIERVFKKNPKGPAVVPIHTARYIEPFLSPESFMNLFQDVRTDENILLTGLHACGDLSATMIHTYANCDQVKALVSISCCYMKLTTSDDDVANCEDGKKIYGYPMSQHIRSLPDHHLSYKSRATACHANENFVDSLRTNGDHLRVHCCRSVLENLIREACPTMIRPGVQIAQKIQLNDFMKYVKIAFDKLGFSPPRNEVVDNEKVQFMLSEWRKVVMYYALSLLLAPLIETVVLLDRAIFLYENGYDSRIECIFNPKLSPRCFALTARKK